MNDLFRTGTWIGFAVAAPVGPIGLLILRRSLTDGKLAGFISGLGAAFADVLCGGAAAFGLTAILNLVDAHTRAIQIVGGLVLIAFGVSTLRSKPPSETAKRPLHERNLAAAFFSTTLLTLANPVTLLGMVAICAAAGIGQSTDAKSAAAFVAGIFTGSAAWWLILSFCASWLGKFLKPSNITLINLVSGALLIGFGVYQVFHF